MAAPPDNDLQARRAAYRATSEALARLWTRDLANLTDAEALRRMEALVTPDKPWRERPDWSGLVEQQALFMKAMAKQRGKP
jgi:hypothetical protein